MSIVNTGFLGVSGFRKEHGGTMSEIWWRSGVPIEATISQPVVDRVPWSEHYSVLRCCSAAVGSERGKRLEVGGRR